VTKVVFDHDFYLGKYEVTQGEWETVMGSNPSHFSRTGMGKDAVKDVSDINLKRFPVENVSWNDCQLFLVQLNKKEKEIGWVYRLPKESEWEYACRGGPVNKSASAFNYYFAKPTNTLLPDQANFNPGNNRALKRTCQVGSYEPNSLGLYDMHGNLYELCDDAENMTDGASPRVYRSGGWHISSEYSQAAFRSAIPPSLQFDNLGFRVARVPSVLASK
jgi:eukaryotic-like serine/threonine-protein kinase